MAQVTNQVFYATTYHPIQAGSIDGTDTAAHDNAVYRALLASSTGLYDPTGDPKAEGDPYCTLFVGRLARHTTEETLKLAMSKFGRVKHLRLVRHIVTGASQGYAFVEFETDKEMLYAYEMAHSNIIDGSSVVVDYNRQQLMPGWIPRRLGGGLGGRKESGQLRFGGRDRPFRAPLRPIPDEQLIKLGIPLPPVGRYMSRFLLPPVPRRSESPKEVAYRHRSSQRDSRGRTSQLEIVSGDKWSMERVSSRSPERSSKPREASARYSKHRRDSHSIEEVETKSSDRRVRRHENDNQQKERNVFLQRPATERDYHDDRYSYSESSRIRSGNRESIDFERSSPGNEGGRKFQLGHERRERKRSRSRESTDYEKRSPGRGKSKAKHKHESRRKKRSRSRESNEHEKRSPRYEEEKSRHRHEGKERRRSGSKHRSTET